MAKSKDVFEIIAVLVLTPFTIVGHWSGLIFGALSRGFREGREASDAFLTEVQKASDRKHASNQ
jgi:hypothetical protein